MINVLLPEILVATGLLGLLTIYVCLDKKYHGSMVVGIVLLYALTFWELSGLTVPDSPIVWWEGLFVYDGLSQTSKMLIMATMVVISVCAHAEQRDFSFPGIEFYSLMGFSALGMMVTVSAGHVISLFVGLELMYLPLYALVMMRKKNAQAQEAAIKYIILGALATAFLLYGASLLYAVTGSMHFEDIHGILSGIGGDSGWQGRIPEIDNYPIINVASLLILAAILFKLGVMPFHIWVPDVYQGASNVVVATIASLPKLVLVVVWCRVFGDTGALAPLIDSWQWPVLVIGVGSILLGNLAGLAQTNIKRMLAYSSISHMGLLLLALGLGTREGLAACWIYIIGYMVMTVTIFAALARCRQSGREAVLIEEMKGLYHSHRGYAVVLIVSLFSLMGMPPFLGFFVKIQVLMALIHGGKAGLALVAVLGSVIGAFYYLRVIQNILFYRKDATGKAVEIVPDRGSDVVLFLATVAVGVSGLVPIWLLTLAKMAG